MPSGRVIAPSAAAFAPATAVGVEPVVTGGHADAHAPAQLDAGALVAFEQVHGQPARAPARIVPSLPCLTLTTAAGPLELLVAAAFVVACA